MRTRGTPISGSGKNNIDLSSKKSKEPVFAPGMNSTPGVAGRMCWIYLFWVGNFFGAAAEFRG